MTPYTKELHELLDKVNADANRRIKPVTDLRQYGRDKWVVPPKQGGRGDCEDFALAKQEDLRGLGIDQDDMWLVLCWTPNGEYHLVLAVHTTAGDYVLDNLKDRVHRWDELTGYRWHMFRGKGGQWWMIAPPFENQQSSQN